MTSRICRSVVGRFAKSDPEPILKVWVSKTDKRTAKLINEQQKTLLSGSYYIIIISIIQQLKFKVPCSDNSATHLAVRFWKATTMGPDSIPDRFPAYLFIQTQPMLWAVWRRSLCAINLNVQSGSQQIIITITIVQPGNHHISCFEQKSKPNILF